SDGGERGGFIEENAGAKVIKGIGKQSVERGGIAHRSRQLRDARIGVFVDSNKCRPKRHDYLTSHENLLFTPMSQDPFPLATAVVVAPMRPHPCVFPEWPQRLHVLHPIKWLQGP